MELKKIIDSFYLKDELNPTIWDNPEDPQESKLKEGIRDRILKIANYFIEYLDVEAFVQDIIFIGSLTGFNWSDFSDFDVHIVYDFSDFGDKEKLYRELFDLKKTVFNSQHNITIKGFDVELFVEDEKSGNKSAGEFSILNNRWNKIPDFEAFELDEKKIKEKSKQWMEIIDGAVENAKDKTLDDAIDLMAKYKNKLKKYRTCGLEKGGEYSYENLVFKVLRRNGYLSKLVDFKNDYVDKSLSLEQEKFE
jgi:hypothetical protein